MLSSYAGLGLATMHVTEIKKVGIKPRAGWSVTHSGLYHLAPELAPSVEGLPQGFTAWDLYFLEDLLQATNPEKGQLLDVGWYPHADPAGSFRLLLIKYRPSAQADRNEYFWEEPLVDFGTRSVDTLLAEINRLLQ